MSVEKIIVCDKRVPVASYYMGCLPGRLRVSQFADGAAIIEIAAESIFASIHTRHSELREFAAALIAAADAFDAQQVSP